MRCFRYAETTSLGHLVVSGELVVSREKEHAVAFVPLAHGYAGAVPVAVLDLRL